MHQTGKANIHYGLQITLHYEKNEHNQRHLVYLNEEYVKPIMWENFFLIESSAINFVSIDKRVITNLPPPYSDCIATPENFKDKNELIQMTMKHNSGQYNREHCDYFCIYRSMMTVYNCSMDIVQKFDDKAFCSEILENEVTVLFSLFQ